MSKEAASVTGYIIAGVIGLGVLAVGGAYFTGYLNQIREGQRTKVNQESFAYQRGMQNELNELYLQYQSADVPGRIGIKNVVMSRFGSIDTSEYEPHLQQFLVEVGAR